MAVSFAELVDFVEDFCALLRYAEDAQTDASTLDTTHTSVLSTLNGNSHSEYVDRAVGLRDDRRSGLSTYMSRVKGALDALLTSDLLIDDDASGDSPSATTMLQVLHDLFIEHSTDIAENAVTIGTITADTDGTDTGNLVIDTTLDGVTIPIAEGFASHRNFDLASEIAFTDDLRVECVTSDPRTSVQFSVKGSKSSSSRYSRFDYDGVGDLVTMRVADNDDVLNNGNLETFSSNEPSNWTGDSGEGTAGTHVLQETGASNVWVGDSSLELVGDGSLASIRRYQLLPNLIAGRRYAMGAWYKGNASVAAGDLTIRLTWDGASLSAGEFIDVPQATLASNTDFTFVSAFVNVPLNLPDNLRFEIVYDDTPTDSQPIYVSNVALVPATYFNGVCGAIFDGKDRFLTGDTFEFTITNDEAGKIQTFFRDFYRFQLPSDASPSLADTLIS